MRYEEKQRLIEKKTERIIDDLADELDLKFEYYPEIYWLGRKRNFESLGISKDYMPFFNDIKQEKSAVYLYDERMILSSSEEDKILGEEAGHFLHFENSKINPANIDIDNPIDAKSLKIISESIGFFCSKLIDCKRKEEYSEFKNFRDFIYKSLIKNKIPFKDLEKKVQENYELKDDFFSYKQGYSLGEELFNNYLAGNINKKQIKRLMKNPFKENFSATEKLLYLRKRFMKNRLSA